MIFNIVVKKEKGRSFSFFVTPRRRFIIEILMKNSRLLIMNFLVVILVLDSSARKYDDPFC